MEYHEVASFIETEADLLDRGEFTEWFELFTDDGFYWVPADPGQTDPFNHVSLFYDDHDILRTRVQRLQHPQVHCQSPRSRSVRVMSVPRIEKSDNTLSVRAISKFVMIEDRIGADKRIYAGSMSYELTEVNNHIRMKSKTVFLTDCDQTFPALTIPF